MAVTEQQRAEVARLLGREPRGLEEIAVAGPQGEPMVIRVAALVDGKPFPTLFWLVDADLNYRIDREEAGGLIARLQARVDTSPQLQSAMGEDHRDYIELRNSYLSADLRREVDRLGFTDVFRHKGIGGIADPSRIRCLHTWYAAHLVRANTVGQLLDDHWQAQEQADCN